MASAAPSGGTFIDNVKRDFPQVTVDESNEDAINTTEFLEATEGLISLFDILGSTAFAPVKSDMTGNVKKIRDRQLQVPLDSDTLQKLVRTELAAKKHTATEGLVWLNRGLDFTCQSLSINLEKPDEELSTSFRTGYGNTLKQYHGMLVKPIMSMAMSALPYRADFYAKLGDDKPLVERQMRDSVKALERVVGILNTFLAKKENKW